MWPTCNPYRSLDHEAEGYAVRRGSSYPAARVSILLVEARSEAGCPPKPQKNRRSKPALEQAAHRFHNINHENRP